MGIYANRYNKVQMFRKRNINKRVKRIKSNWEKLESIRYGRLYLPFVQFVMLMPYMTEDTIKGLVLLPCPRTFHKVAIPQDLQQETFGTLTRLQTAPKDNDYLKTCCALVSALTGISTERVASSKAIEVLGIVNMIQVEMERIGKLFKSLESDKTSEEIRAGIEKLDFGAFGIVDWYAQRMGIVDHEEVFATPWARIYQCMRIDHEQGEFEKRYRKILENRSKMKR